MIHQVISDFSNRDFLKDMEFYVSCRGFRTGYEQSDQYSGNTHLRVNWNVKPNRDIDL